MNCNRIIYDKNCNTIIQDDVFDSEYIYVYILQLNQTTGIISNVFIKTKEDEVPKFGLGLDGFYTLVTMKVPNGPGTEYYYDSGKFYHFYKEIELSTLLELNPQVTHLEVTYDYYFQTCRLRKCYINTCYQIFDQTASINCAKGNVDKNLIYKRDLLWSALNVIKYMTSMDQFEEAERLLERIMGCNGLCSNQQNRCNDGHKSNSCGCR